MGKLREEQGGWCCQLGGRGMVLACGRRLKEDGELLRPKQDLW